MTVFGAARLLAPKAITPAMYGAEAVGSTKRYKKQIQQQTQPDPAGHAPGAPPPMKKISARQRMTEILEKNAGVAPPKMLGTAVGMGLALTGVGLATRGTLAGVSALHTKFKAERMFSELVGRYPEIRRHPRAREYFDMIVAYAPSLLKHPTAIGDFLRRQLEYPSSSIEFVRQLADLEKTVASTPGLGQYAVTPNAPTPDTFGW